MVKNCRWFLTDQQFWRQREK